MPWKPIQKTKNKKSLQNSSLWRLVNQWETFSQPSYVRCPTEVCLLCFLWLLWINSMIEAALKNARYVHARGPMCVPAFEHVSFHKRISHFCVTARKSGGMFTAFSNVKSIGSVPELLVFSFPTVLSLVALRSKLGSIAIFNCRQQFELSSLFQHNAHYRLLALKKAAHGP